MCKIATAFMECGLYAKAEQYYKTAAESAQNLLQAKCQFGVAVVQRELYKNSDRANELFAQATKMVDEVGDEDMQQKATPYADIARNQGISCLVKQDFPAVRAHFQRGIVCARDTSSLQNFLIPLLNYFALATARQAETVKSAGGDAQALFQEATPYFADARKKYLDYAEANAQVLDQGCQDWASHVYHDALAAFMMGDLSRAYIGYTKTYEIRVSCNLQGQQRNRLADVFADFCPFPQL